MTFSAVLLTGLEASSSRVHASAPLLDLDSWDDVDLGDSLQNCTGPSTSTPEGALASVPLEDIALPQEEPAVPSAAGISTQHQVELHPVQHGLACLHSQLCVQCRWEHVEYTSRSLSQMFCVAS